MFWHRGTLFFGRDDDGAAEAWAFRRVTVTFEPDLPKGFGWNIDPPGMYCAYAPLGFIAATSAAFAAFPWLPRRFSVRTLLIVTTLAAIVLGLIVGYVKGPNQ
jgi:hypothetical protein